MGELCNAKRDYRAHRFTVVNWNSITAYCYSVHVTKGFVYCTVCTHGQLRYLLFKNNFLPGFLRSPLVNIIWISFGLCKIHYELIFAITKISHQLNWSSRYMCVLISCINLSKQKCWVSYIFIHSLICI